MADDVLERLSLRLGHRFGRPALLEQALTHRSAGANNYERLEFLGDALLNFVVAQAAFAAQPRCSEGELSRLRAALVREAALARAAKRIDLGEALRLGPGELRSGGYRRDSILADTLEALIGAVLLDAGFEAASALCHRLLQPEIEALPTATAVKDAKTRLQEHLQAQAAALPQYQVLSEAGPVHRPQFRVACILQQPSLRGEGLGSSRQAAEQEAAEQVLAMLGLELPQA